MTFQAWLQIEEGDPEDVLLAVEEWVRGDDDGKAWLGRLGADVGVPVQLLLPFEQGEVEENG